MIENPEKALLECLIEQKAIETKNEIIYTAGYSGYDFFDLSTLTLSPKTSEKVVNMYVDLLREVVKNNINFNKLAFIDRNIGPMTVASQLSLKTGYEIIVVKTRIPCSCNLCKNKLRIKGNVYPPLSEKDRVIIISNVVTRGGTVMNAIDAIEGIGAKAVAVIVILDRQTNIGEKTVKELLEERGVKLFSFITRDRLLTGGFIEPSKDDLINLDFFSLLKKAVFIKYLGSETGKSLEEIIDSQKNVLDIIAEDILKSKKDIRIDEENKRFVRNTFLSLMMQVRTNTLISKRGI